MKNDLPDQHIYCGGMLHFSKPNTIYYVGEEEKISYPSKRSLLLYREYIFLTTQNSWLPIFLIKQLHLKISCMRTSLPTTVVHCHLHFFSVVDTKVSYLFFPGKVCTSSTHSICEISFFH